MPVKPTIRLQFAIGVLVTNTKTATEKGLVVFYTDIGKDKLNNRSMMNICAGFTLPSVPNWSIDLVLCTQEFQSILLAEAKSEAEQGVISQEELAEEVFQKHGVNIRKAFDFLLRDLFGLNPEFFYVLCDRAGENVKGFGSRYLCCFAHQLDNSFKWAVQRLHQKHPNSALVVTWKAAKCLTSYCNARGITFSFSRKGVTNSLKLSNHSKTR